MAQYYRITKEHALEEIRRITKATGNPPEAVAIGLMRRIDDWDEHSAILKALDEFKAERS